MDLVYIPQLEGASGFGAPSRYLIVRAIPDGGRVELRDRCVTRIEAKTSDPLELVFPPVVPGAARDFFVRLVVTADAAPEVTFAPPEGEAVSFENAEEGVLACDVGINVFAFTENDEGIFLVNRKVVDLMQEVSFDANGGTCPVATRSYRLGAAYGDLPVPSRAGFVCTGWFTAPEGGVKVSAGDRCKTGVAKLYARWEVYVDPFRDAICPDGDLTFFTRGDDVWFLDHDWYASPSASARSGVIGDSQSSSLVTKVVGPGLLSFRWDVSSENGCDRLELHVDGSCVDAISGCWGGGWRDYSWRIEGAGEHEIEWVYLKDGSVSDGSDCGWVDDVAWRADP